MARRDPSAYARRNFPWLLALFGAFVALGLWRDNAPALIGGAAGLLWLILSARRAS